jgi:hypothetical protein
VGECRVLFVGAREREPVRRQGGHRRGKQAQSAAAGPRGGGIEQKQRGGRVDRRWCAVRMVCDRCRSERNRSRGCGCGRALSAPLTGQVCEMQA